MLFLLGSFLPTFLFLLLFLLLLPLRFATCLTLECKPPSPDGAGVVINPDFCLDIARHWLARRDSHNPLIVDTRVPPFRVDSRLGYMPARLVEHFGTCFVLVMISSDHTYDIDAKSDQEEEEEEAVVTPGRGRRLARANAGMGHGRRPGENDVIMLTYAQIGVWLMNLVKKCFVQEKGNGYAGVEGRLRGAREDCFHCRGVWAESAARLFEKWEFERR